MIDMIIKNSMDNTIDNITNNGKDNIIANIIEPPKSDNAPSLCLLEITMQLANIPQRVPKYIPKNNEIQYFALKVNAKKFLFLTA